MSDQRSIELFEDLAFQRRQWRWQRAGWVLMGLFTAAGLLGFFGSGPLSNGTARSSDGVLAVDYERFIRRHSPSTLRVSLSPAATSTDRVALRVNRAYLDDAMIQSIVPEPAHVASGADEITYQFDSPPTRRKLVVVFDLEAKKAGTVRLRLRTGGTSEVAVDQLIYP